MILRAVVVRHGRHPPWLLSAIAIVVRHRHCCLPLPSSIAAAIIATLLSLLSLAARFLPSPSWSDT
jgi:hypothetical protein